VIYTPHGFAFNGPQGLPRRVLSVAVERALALMSAAIVCVSYAERRKALEHRIARPERLHVVHNGCPPCESAGPADPLLEALGEEGPLAGCVTLLRPKKGVEVFLEAAPRILRAVPDARLVVVGNGELRPALEASAAGLGLDGRLHFLDFLPPASRQLACLDVFVLPSLAEAFPISVLEALACGVPQVATDVGGVLEAVADGETGRLCPPGDPEALAESVIGLLREAPGREAMAAASRERHRSRFSLEPMVAGTAAVYDGVLVSAAG